MYSLTWLERITSQWQSYHFRLRSVPESGAPVVPEGVARGRPVRRRTAVLWNPREGERGGQILSVQPVWLAAGDTLVDPRVLADLPESYSWRHTQTGLHLIIALTTPTLPLPPSYRQASGAVHVSCFRLQAQPVSCSGYPEELSSHYRPLTLIPPGDVASTPLRQVSL